MVSNRASSYDNLTKRLGTLGDVQLDKDIPDKSQLSYDGENEVWVNRPAGDVGLSTKNIMIDVSNWIDSGSSYTLPIPEAMHGQGSTIFVKMFEGVTSLTEVVVGWSSDLLGNIELNVSKIPDGRVAGIVCVCKLLII